MDPLKMLGIGMKEPMSHPEIGTCEQRECIHTHPGHAVLNISLKPMSLSTPPSPPGFPTPDTHTQISVHKRIIQLAEARTGIVSCWRAVNDYRTDVQQQRAAALDRLRGLIDERASIATSRCEASSQELHTIVARIDALSADFAKLLQQPPADPSGPLTSLDHRCRQLIAVADRATQLVQTGAPPHLDLSGVLSSSSGSSASAPDLPHSTSAPAPAPGPCLACLQHDAQRADADAVRLALSEQLRLKDESIRSFQSALAAREVHIAALEARVAAAETALKVDLSKCEDAGGIKGYVAGLERNLERALNIPDARSILEPMNLLKEAVHGGSSSNGGGGGASSLFPGVSATEPMALNGVQIPSTEGPMMSFGTRAEGMSESDKLRSQYRRMLMAMRHQQEREKEMMEARFQSEVERLQDMLRAAGAPVPPKPEDQVKLLAAQNDELRKRLEEAAEESSNRAEYEAFRARSEAERTAQDVKDAFERQLAAATSDLAATRAQLAAHAAGTALDAQLQERDAVQTAHAAAERVALEDAYRATLRQREGEMGALLRELKEVQQDPGVPYVIREIASDSLAEGHVAYSAAYNESRPRGAGMVPTPTPYSASSAAVAAAALETSTSTAPALATAAAVEAEVAEGLRATKEWLGTLRMQREAEAQMRAEGTVPRRRGGGSRSRSISPNMSGGRPGRNPPMLAPPPPPPSGPLVDEPRVINVGSGARRRVEDTISQARCLRCGLNDEISPSFCAFHPFLLKGPSPFQFGPEYHVCKTEGHCESDPGCLVRHTHFYATGKLEGMLNTISKAL